MIVTAEKLVADKVKNGTTREAKVIFGNGKDQLKNSKIETSDPVLFKVGAPDWKNSAARYELYSNMKVLQDKMLDAEKNSAPLPSDIMTYLEYLFIDVNRLADEKADYSGNICNVLFRPDATDPTKMRDLIPYVGKEKVITGENDSVPMIEETGANLATVDLSFKAFGHKSSIRNMVFNPFATTQRILEAAATINVDSRNNDVIGTIVGKTYPALQSQAADATGATFDQKMYLTIQKALKKLAVLKHPLTGQTLATMGAFAGGCKILAHPADAWDIDRVIRGQLMLAGGIAANMSALPISEIIPYGGGIMNGLTWGKEVLSLPGVTAGTAYLFLPNALGGFVVDKITQTLEVGSGSVLTLSTEERAWYRVNGVFLDWLLGGAKDNTNSGLGCIVKITLPAA
jgi:hypothetical protein